MLNPDAAEPPTGPTVPILPLHYDPARAVLPDPKLTPGDTFPGATADDVCSPGWAREHRQVTEGMRNKVYAEYGRSEGLGCCEVDHLIPLELGGSNDIKNLWAQPDDPRPGDAEKRISSRMTSTRAFARMKCRWLMRRSASHRIGSSAGRNTWYPIRINVGGSEPPWMVMVRCPLAAWPRARPRRPDGQPARCYASFVERILGPRRVRHFLI